MDGARKCIHCDSFQDWRRHLNISSTVLALMIALISVISLSYPIFRELWISDDSEIHLNFIRVKSDSTLQFLASNSGNRPGLVLGHGFLMVSYNRPKKNDNNPLCRLYSIEAS